LKTFLYLLFLILLSVGTAAAQRDLRFERLTVDDGLSQSSVNAIFKDSRGFLWIGTQDGLNRYDGYSFTVYKNRQRDTTSLSNNWIWKIFEDSRGRLWLGTFGGGLNLYDRVKDCFRRYSFTSPGSHPSYSNSIRDIYEYPKGVLWLGTDHGYFRFLPDSGHYTFFPPEEENFNYLQITKKAGEDKLLLLTGTDIYLAGVNGNRGSGLLNGALQGGIISRLYQVDEDRMLIGTSQSGLYEYHFSEDKFFPANEVNELLNAPVAILDITADETGRIWIGTEQGAVIMPSAADAKSHNPYRLCQNGPCLLQHQPDDISSLSHSYVNDLYSSDDGLLWLGTRNGLNRFDHVRPRFAHFNQGAKQLSAHNVLPLIQSRYGHIWIGTSSGLNVYDPRNGLFESFLADDKEPALHNDYILSLSEDKQGQLWVGTRGAGLMRLQFHDPQRPQKGIKNIDRFGADVTGSSFSGKNVHSVYIDRQQRLWAGAIGLNLYDPSQENFRHFPHRPNDPEGLSHIYIFDMLEDSRGNFWVGTAGGGLNRMDRDKGTFERFINDPDDPSSLVHDMVLCLVEVSDGSVWIGTAGGLSRLIIEKDNAGNERIRFKNYTESDGLPNNVVYGIVEDDNGGLWISTNNGIARLELNGPRLEVRSYSVEDGLQSNEFNQDAFLKDERGYIYFGGINGLTVFLPDSLSDNSFEPAVSLNGLYIRGKRVTADGRGPDGFALDSTLIEKRRLAIGYRENAFTLEFAALGFLQPHKNRHAYMLEGFDEEWIETDQRRATYTNLDPGSYLFRVRGSNNDGIWSGREARLRIDVAPPPWRSWWAYGLYALVFAAAFGGLVKMRERRLTRRQEQRLRIERARAEERELVRRKSSADFHDEAGNLITKINLFTELARRHAREDNTLGDYLGQIESHTRRLSSGMRDFIWVLDPGHDTLYDTLVRICDFGNGICTAAGIDFKYDNVSDLFRQVPLAADDRRSLLMLFKEAVNNAVKYAGAGCITFSFKLDDDELKLTLSDDGNGFDVKARSSGYGLNNMRARAEKASAGFILDSGPGKGTTVSVIKKISRPTANG